MHIEKSSESNVLIGTFFEIEMLRWYQGGDHVY